MLSKLIRIKACQSTMDHDALPRLSARLMEAASVPGSNGALRASGASSARRMCHPRSLMPKSAGASSPQRRNTGGTHPFVVRVVGAANEEAAIEGYKSASAPDGFTLCHLTGHKSQQSPRPSSTRASPQQASHAMSFNQVAFGDQQGAQQYELTSVQCENEQLRREVNLLQQKLVEKMRGNSKILVSGGQFRASAKSLVARIPGTSQKAPTSATWNGVQPCNTCVSLRETFKKARDAADQEQRVLAYRISQLERDESEAQASRNQQEEELSSLRYQLHQVLIHDAETQAKLKNQIEELKRLQDDCARCVTENDMLRLRGTARDSVNLAERRHYQRVTTETQTEINYEDVSLKHIDIGQHEVDAIHHQLEQAQAANEELERSFEELRAQVSVMQAQHAQALHDHANERRATEEQRTRSQNECSVLSAQNADLASKVAALEALLHSLQQLMSASQALHNDNAAARQLQLLAKDEHLAVLENERAEADALASTTRLRIAELEELLAESIQRHQALEFQAQNTAGDMEKTKRELCITTDELASLRKLHAQNLSESLVASKALEAEQLACTASREESSKFQKALDEVSARLAAAEAELVAREEVQSQLKRSHAASLEKAMQSLVRLCVVAPTVNVHLTSNSGVAAGGISSAVICRSALPHKQVQMVVEEDVLPLFTTVFVQNREGCSPQGGPMDPWLQTLLRDMQESLATHLQKLYSATTTAASTD